MNITKTTDEVLELAKYVRDKAVELGLANFDNQESIELAVRILELSAVQKIAENINKSKGYATIDT